jgi:hypothetical protein
MTALTATAPHFTDQQLAEFHATGVVRLGRVISDRELTDLRQRIDDIMLGRQAFSGMMQLDSDTGQYGDIPAQTAGHKGATLNYRKIEGLEADPLFFACMTSPLFRSIATRILGPEVSIYRSMFMNKPAGKGTVLPWHQDGGTNWNLTGDPLVTIWLALDPATKDNGCVQVIPGSHRLGLLSEYGHTITAEQEAQYCPPERQELLELQPGEAVLLHNWVLHASGTNPSGMSRRAFSLCLMDAAIRSRGQQQYPKLFGGNSLAG